MHVVTESETGWNWDYDAEARAYFRYNQAGELTGKITGANLPNPARLWAFRTSKLGVSQSSEMGQKIKPQPETYALFQHWQSIVRKGG